MPDFQTAYGITDQVPEWVSQLSSPNEEISTEAIVSLFEHLCHQGTVYEGSLSALPYLAECLALPKPASTYAVSLIASIGLGRSESAVLLVKIHREIKPHLSELANFLRDETSDVRGPVALLLARYPAQLELFVDQLTVAHIAETDPDVKELMRQSIETLQVKR